jgi:hypothetical protein
MLWRKFLTLPGLELWPPRLSSPGSVAIPTVPYWTRNLYCIKVASLQNPFLAWNQKFSKWYRSCQENIVFDRNYMLQNMAASKSEDQHWVFIIRRVNVKYQKYFFYYINLYINISYILSLPFHSHDDCWWKQNSSPIKPWGLFSCINNGSGVVRLILVYLYFSY